MDNDITQWYANFLLYNLGLKCFEHYSIFNSLYNPKK